MKSNQKIVPLAILMLFAMSCAQAPEVSAVDPAQQAADIAAIKQNEEQKFPNAIASGDVSTASEVFTDDAIWMLQGVPADIGRDAIISRLNEWFDTTSYENVEQTVEEIEVLGDWAWARGSFSTTYTPRSGGEATSETGKYLIVAKRQPDGSWKTYRACANTDAPVLAPSS